MPLLAQNINLTVEMGATLFLVATLRSGVPFVHTFFDDVAKNLEATVIFAAQKAAAKIHGVEAPPADEILNVELAMSIEQLQQTGDFFSKMSEFFAAHDAPAAAQLCHNLALVTSTEILNQLNFPSRENPLAN